MPDVCSPPDRSSDPSGMIIWVDAQLSPRTARWIAANFPLTAAPLRELGLRNSSDEEIVAAAWSDKAIVLAKDIDFETALQRLLAQHLATALTLLGGSEDLVEIGGA